VYKKLPCKYCNASLNALVSREGKGTNEGANECMWCHAWFCDGCGLPWICKPCYDRLRADKQAEAFRCGGRFLEIEKVLTVTTWASIFCFFVPMLSPFLIGWFVEIPAWFYIPSLPSMCIFLFSLVKAQDLAKKTHGRMERLFKDSAQSSATSA
jgi:hypothetical protein